MPQSEWDAFQRELESLANRLTRLERHVGIPPEVPQAAPPLPSPAASPVIAESPPEFEPSALAPVLGRAVLGLAGAYLLRAFTESGTLPHRAGVGCGLLYAIFWLVWAARTPASKRLETALHSLTSVLVLSPLLWEATLRFHAISTWTAGAVLLAFTLFGLAVSWRKDLLILATIATLAGLGTAAGLLLATHDVLPFTFVFLAIAAAVEVSACLEHWLSERWLAATAANLAVLLATWLVTREYGLPPDYAPIPHGALLAAQAALPAIYLSSTIIRTLFRGFTFTFFETAQCVLALVLGVGGCLRLSAEDPRVAPSIGAISLLCAGACYFVSFLRLDGQGKHGRNFYTYSTFGILLAFAATSLVLAGDAESVAWSVLALGCIWAGSSYSRLTLQLHGAIYLLMALVNSGMLAESAHAILGTASTVSYAQLLIGAGLCAIGLKSARAHQWLSAAFCAGLVWLLAGVFAAALTAGYHASFGADAPHSYCATLRTAVLAMASLLLAWAGARWDRVELSRLMYPLMLLGGYRLLLEDMRQERKAAAVFSLLIYGAALIALPRLMRARSASAKAAGA